MATSKVIEISASSANSFEDAIASGTAKAAESINGIQGAWVSEQKVIVANNRVRVSGRSQDFLCRGMRKP